MKKNLIVVLFIVFIAVPCFVPFNNKQLIVIKSSLYDVSKQINDLNNWKKWNLDFRNDTIKIKGNFNSDQFANITESYSYLLHHINPLLVSVTKTINDKISTSKIEITSVSDSTTAVIWREKISVFGLIKGNSISNHSRRDNLDNLKKLMEDPTNKYGFFIKLVPVKDTLILTAEANNNQSNIVSTLYKKLQTFITINNLPAEKNYFYTTQLNDNKIAVGIPVYKQANNYDNIKFLQLPGNGRLVEGIYSGKIADKRSIYTAINNFMLDQHLKQVAKPFEQYIVADTILDNHKDVNLKIYYPVF